jgi:hypothetical protein
MVAHSGDGTTTSSSIKAVGNSKTVAVTAIARKKFQSRPRYDSMKRNNRRSKRGQHSTHSDTKDCCTVCALANPKYKCPKCRQPYCSVSCCKSHRDSCSAHLGTESSILQPSSITTLKDKSKYLPQDTLEIYQESYITHPSAAAATSKEEDEDVEKWPITDEMKRSLSDSPWLRKELVDGGLRQIITNIDSSPYEQRKELLHKGICDNSNFRNFIDQLLVTAGVLKKSENGLLVLDIPSTKTDQRPHPAILHNTALSSDDEEECSDTAHVESFIEEGSDEGSSNTSDESSDDECSTESLL